MNDKQVKISYDTYISNTFIPQEKERFNFPEQIQLPHIHNFDNTLNEDIIYY